MKMLLTKTCIYKIFNHLIAVNHIQNDRHVEETIVSLVIPNSQQKHFPFENQCWLLIGTEPYIHFNPRSKCKKLNIFTL